MFETRDTLNSCHKSYTEHLRPWDSRCVCRYRHVDRAVPGRDSGLSLPSDRGSRLLGGDPNVTGQVFGTVTTPVIPQDCRCSFIFYRFL